MTILESQAQLASGATTAVQLTQRSLDAIAAAQPRLNAFLAMMGEQALDRARALDSERAQGKVRSPLHGVPVAVKDVFSTKGVRTTCGSKFLRDNIPSIDAAVVERLHNAGAVIVGKTHMHEWAYGVTSNNPHYGPVRNPWNTECVPGGSSGGSGATVAAGHVAMAMGSDTGGSIRIPAAFCGTVGIKPTTGRVSRFGVLPLDFTLDHMGPLTMTVRDAAAVLQVLAGHDPRDESSSRAPVPSYDPGASPSLAGLRIGLPENFYFDVTDTEISASVRRVAELAGSLGAAIVPVRVPDMAALNTVGRVILLSEAAAALARYTHRRDDFGADVLSLLDQGRLLAATDYVNAQRLRRHWLAEFAHVFDNADLILTPTTPNPAPRIGQMEVTLGGVPEDVRLTSTRLVRGINVTGHPAISIPCGLTSSRLPIGAQIIGRYFDEPTVFRAAAALESALVRIGPPPAIVD